MFAFLNIAAIIVSIVLGCWSWSELRFTRAKLAEAEIEIASQTKDLWLWHDAYKVQEKERREYMMSLHQCTNAWRRTSIKYRTMYAGFRELLDRHGIAAVVIAETGEVQEIPGPPPASQAAPTPPGIE